MLKINIKHSITSAKLDKHYKTDKIDTTIEICIFKLVFASNVTLNKQRQNHKMIKNTETIRRLKG